MDTRHGGRLTAKEGRDTLEGAGMRGGLWEEWEKWGIARHVNWPRTKCSILGKNISGELIEDLRRNLSNSAKKDPLTGLWNRKFLEDDIENYFIPIFDNEEVGSRTKQGADSDFLHSLIDRINDNLGRSREECQSKH